MISGIYGIYCKVNKKLYIGSSNNIERRWKIHRSLLKHNKHFNKYLQQSYNKYGLNEFIYLIIEEKEERFLLNREKLFIYNLNTLIPSGFNIAENTTAPMLGRKHTTDSLSKMSLSQSGSLNAMFGKKRTNEEKLKMSIARKAVVTQEHKNKMSELASLRVGDKNHFFGKKHSDSTKLKQSLVKMKLKPEQYSEAERLLRENKLTQLQIAQQFNVGRHVITSIKKRMVK